MAERQNTPDLQINLLAPILGWLVPGLGHWSLGHRKRACYIAAGIIFLYLTGLLVGGLSVIDRQGDFWWFCGQVFVGPPTLLIQYWMQNHPTPDDLTNTTTLFATPSFARVNEVGMLYTTLAGMLNLVAILDAVHRPKYTQQCRRSESSANSEPAT